MKKYFLNERFVLLLILLNALLIFIQEFELKGNFLDYFEPIFTIAFVLEMFVKIKEYGFKSYISDGWNRLDFILITVSIPSLALIFNNDIPFQLNIFLTLRVFRVFKFFRLIRFFPNVNTLIASIQRALKASYIVFLGFFLLIFIVSLLSCSIFKNIAPEYFAKPVASFYSIFRLFSVEGWYDIPDLIASRPDVTIAFFPKLYFVILLLGGGIIGLTLVNSIFVNAMVSDNNDDLQKDIEDISIKIDDLSKKIDTLPNSQNNLKI